MADEKSIWEKAQSFVARYSNAAIRAASDTVIQTGNPSINGIALSVIKIPQGDKFMVQTQCHMTPASPFDNEPLQHRCAVTAAALIMYMVTGEEPPASLVQDCVEVKLPQPSPVTQ